MSEEDKRIMATAYNFVISILSHGDPNAECFAEIFEIKQGNKKALLEHLKAINSITGDAIKLLEEENEKI